MITGTENNYDLVLRTGAWDRDIFIPRALAGIITGGIGAAAVADTEIYRAYTFENNFWKWINKIVNELGKENASTPFCCTDNNPWKGNHAILC
jgi:hypothetical protein